MARPSRHGARRSPRPERGLHLIERGRGSRALFAGHGHIYLKYERAGVLLVETVDLKSGVQPGYVLAELEPATGQVTLVNDADIPWGTLGTP